MSDKVNLMKRVASLNSSDQFDGYSKVVLAVSDEVEYTAGTDLGRTLTLTCPWGSQEMADNILVKIEGFQYQPFSATGAMLDPAAELGDGVTVGKIYSGIFSKKVSLGPLYTADVSAPGEEKIEYQYPYQSPKERKVARELRGLTAELKIQAGLISAEVTERKTDVETINAALLVQSGEISAKVSKTGGNASSFGWTLLEDSWTVSAGGSSVFKITKDGAEVKGKITATSGKIGGFDIQSNYLSYNNMTWGGTNSNGIYIGTSGIQLGKNFKVDSAGNLTAASGTFTGTVYAGNIQYGGSAGTLSGSGITTSSISGNRLLANTVSTAYTSSGINSSLGYADYSNGVFNGWNTAAYIKATSGIITSFATSDLEVGGYAVVWRTIKDGNGLSQTVLARAS